MTPVRLAFPLAAASVLGACVAVPDVAPPPTAPVARPSSAPVPATDPAPPSTGFIPPRILREAGLEQVIGQDDRALQRLFGEPQLRTPEGDALKLQFGGSQCVLDVFLYPLRPGSDAVATHVEARRSDGKAVDRASCVKALRR